MPDMTVEASPAAVQGCTHDRPGQRSGPTDRFIHVVAVSNVTGRATLSVIRHEFASGYRLGADQSGALQQSSSLPCPAGRFPQPR
jgi:hypothetical protein